MEDVVCVVGVDWGCGTHAHAGACTDGGQHSSAFGADAEAVHEWVQDLRRRHPLGQIVIGVEQTRGALMYALQQYDFLNLVPVNPLAAKAYRQALYVSGGKDDPVDAQLLCDFVRVHRSKLRRWRADDVTTRKLRLLTEHRRKLVDQRTALMQALTAALTQYFPQILTWFREPTGRLTRAVLSCRPTLDALVATRKDVLMHLLRDNSRMKPEAIDDLIAKIRAAVPLTNDAAIIEPMSMLAQSYVLLLDAAEAWIAKYDQKIADVWREHPDRSVFDSFPGAGLVMAPRLAVAFGLDRDRYGDATEIQKYSGIAPVVERSGSRTWVHARWQCPKFLRQTFHEYAAASLPFSPWALAFYHQQRDRGAGHHAAVRSLAFRWIRILFHCWKHNLPYDEQEHVKALKRRNSPVARRLVA